MTVDHHRYNYEAARKRLRRALRAEAAAREVYRKQPKDYARLAAAEDETIYATRNRDRTAVIWANARLKNPA